MFVRKTIRRIRRHLGFPRYPLHRREDFRTIGFETFLRNPEEAPASVCRFLDTPFEPQMVNSEGVSAHLGDAAVVEHLKRVHEPVSSEPIGHGLRELPEDQLHTVENIIGHDLQRHGHPQTS